MQSGKRILIYRLGSLGYTIASLPCVAVFSACGLPRQWYPRDNHNKIIYHKLIARAAALMSVSYRKKCILSITADEVYDAVMESLNLRLNIPN